jgi:hypothetical protein
LLAIPQKQCELGTRAVTLSLHPIRDLTPSGFSGFFAVRRYKFDNKFNKIDGIPARVPRRATDARAG